MGKRGPAPTPTAIKRARGVRPARINDREPVPPVASPRAPRSLTAAERKYWHEMAKGLQAKGVLTVWDTHAFATLCQLLARRDRLNASLAEIERRMDAPLEELLEGAVPTPRPDSMDLRRALSSLRETETTLRTYLQEFGLTPSSRSALKVDAPHTSPSVMQPVRIRDRSA